MNPYIVGLIGIWLLCDGWFSLNLYVGKPKQSWLKDHSIRIIRMVIGIYLVAIGGINA